MNSMDKNYILQKMNSKTAGFMKNNAGTILSVLAVAGLVLTIEETIRATIKAHDILTDEDLEPAEKLKKAAPNYIPVVLSGTATSACILGANSYNKKQQLALFSAYSMVDNSYKKYRDTLVELHGEEADKEIRTEMARKSCAYHCTDLDVPDNKVIFYEPVTGECITRYEREVIDAEYHFNRNFTMRGYASLNEFLSFLGIDEVPYGDELGWTVTDGIYWVDFEHDLIENPDGNAYYSINYVFEPDKDYLREWE